MFFAEEFGERSDGAIILCNKGAAGNGWCDTWTDLPAGKHTGTTDFPEGCSWPRFLPDGSGVCWQSAEQKLSIEEGPRDGRFKIYQVPFQDPYYFQDLNPLARNLIAFVVDNTIYVWSADRLATLDTPPVFGSRLIVDEWRGGTRRIVKVGPAPGQETILWSVTGGSWR